MDLIGHSYGGYLSTLLGSRRPDLIRRLGLLCPAGFHRYRMLRSASLMFGAPAVEAMLRKRLPWLAASLSAQALFQIAASSGVMRQIATLEHDAYHGKLPRPVTRPSLVLWGTDDDLHSPFPPVPIGTRDPSQYCHDLEPVGAPMGKRSASGVTSASGDVTSAPSAAPSGGGEGAHLFPRPVMMKQAYRIETPQQMLRGFTQGTGFWIKGGNHPINVDAVGTVCYLLARFLACDDDGSPAATSEHLCSASSHGGAAPVATEWWVPPPVLGSILPARQPYVHGRQRTFLQYVLASSLARVTTLPFSRMGVGVGGAPNAEVVLGAEGIAPSSSGPYNPAKRPSYQAKL